MTVAHTPLAPEDDAAILEDRARSLARPAATALTDTELHVVVRVGGNRLALPAAGARHVTGPKPLAALPTGGEPIVGVAPILGQNVAVVDLATLLDVASELPLARRPLLVVDDGDEAVALLVDEIETLTTVQVSTTEESVGAAPDDPGPRALVGDVVGGLRVLRLDAILAVLPPVDAHRGTSQPPGAEP